MTNMLREVQLEREKHCYGCGTYHTGIKFSCPCRLPYEAFGQPCPCTMCLVKGLCEEECDTFIAYKSYTYREKE
jgi:hypothetical protein